MAMAIKRLALFQQLGACALIANGTPAAVAMHGGASRGCCCCARPASEHNCLLLWPVHRHTSTPAVQVVH